MKDFISSTCLVICYINLITSEQTSDLMKCVFFLVFLATAILWLLNSKAGKNLINHLNDNNHE